MQYRADSVGAYLKYLFFSRTGDDTEGFGRTRIKLTAMAARNLFDLLICTPIPSPRGCMDMPDPMVNRLIPKIRKTVPKMNNTRMPGLFADSEQRGITIS